MLAIPLSPFAVTRDLPKRGPQVQIASDLSETLDDIVYDDTEKLYKLREVGFGPKSAVRHTLFLKLITVNGAEGRAAQAVS